MTSATIRTATTAVASKKEGDISSVFASLSGNAPAPLPPRFANVKQKLIQGREEAITASWKRLLKALEREVRKIEELGSSIIPSIQYDELHDKFPEFQTDLKERGAGVIRGVVPQEEARAYKTDLEKYIKANPSTKGNFRQQTFKLMLMTNSKPQHSHPTTPKSSSSTGHRLKSEPAPTQTS
jgi:hypothetical protein